TLRKEEISQQQRRKGRGRGKKKKGRKDKPGGPSPYHPLSLQRKSNRKTPMNKFASPLPLPIEDIPAAASPEPGLSQFNADQAMNDLWKNRCPRRNGGGGGEREAVGVGARGREAHRGRH
ncbi:hypothetical protein CDAR_450731, partial [Caerostris darwini]